MILKWSQKHSCTHLRNHRVEDCCSYDYQNNPRACHWPIDSWGFKRLKSDWLLTFYLVLSFHENFSKVFVGKNSTIPRRISVTDISEVTDCRQEKKKKTFQDVSLQVYFSYPFISEASIIIIIIIIINCYKNPCSCRS